MKRLMILGYGVVSYLLFFITFVYSIGFIGNLWVPKTIDSTPTMGLTEAILVNLGLLTLFAVQHSGMARPAFKKWLTRFIPEAAERSTYVLLSTVCLAILMIYWAPLGGVIWQVQGQDLQLAMHSLYLLSWLLLLYATFAINHFDLFGLRQVWNAYKEERLRPLQFKTPLLYRLVRHPIYVGWLGIVWFTPTMTVTHAFFAIGATLYILVGLRLEERDLETMHPEYREYKRNVPSLVPFTKRVKNKDILKSV